MGRLLTDERGRLKSEKLTVSSMVCKAMENWVVWLAASRFRATAVCGRIGPFTQKIVFCMAVVCGSVFIFKDLDQAVFFNADSDPDDFSMRIRIQLLH